MNLNRALKNAFTKTLEEATELRQRAFGRAYKYFLSIEEDCEAILKLLDSGNLHEDTVVDLMVIRDDLSDGKNYLKQIRC